MKFVLTLHCETDWNVEGILQGHIDRELHEVGIAHAHRKGSMLVEQSSWNIMGIVSSDLKRGIQTGEIINQYLHVPHGINGGLRECRYGSLEGMNKCDISMILPRWDDCHESYDYRGFGGESYEQVVCRQRSALKDIASRYCDHDIILVVGHGTSMNSLLFALGQQNLPMKRDEIRLLEY